MHLRTTAQPQRHVIAANRPASLLVSFLLMFVTFASVRGDEPADAEKTHHVALFTGSEDNVPFWELFAAFMDEAANDLGIKLEVFYAEGSRIRMETRIDEVCQRDDKPDAIVVQSFKRSGLNSLQIANRNRVPVFLVNAGLTDEQRIESGDPRTKLRYWIGEMLPDDYDAGYQLANELIDKAHEDPRRLGPDGRVHLIGINGVISDSASIQRAAGLQQAVKERSDEAVLDQLIEADWEQDLAHKRCRILHRRYPHASVVWTASDHMAAGAIRAMDDLNLTPGEDVIIGGVDATPEAMQLIEQGTLHATIGGHFMEGGWVMVLLYDYLHGVDLARIPKHFDSPMKLVTRNDLAKYQHGLRKSTWERFDFRRLSLFHDPGLKDYDFGPHLLVTAGELIEEVPLNQDGF